jgi:hypothetical protein
MTKFREMRRYQLSLILIGIAIARTGDRKRLFSRLSIESIKSDRAKRCLQAVVDGDVDEVRGFLLGLGVESNGNPALDSIVDRLHEMKAQDELDDTMRAIVAGELIDDLNTVEKRLETALAAVRASKETRFKPSKGATNGKQ